VYEHAAAVNDRALIRHRRVEAKYRETAYKTKGQ